MRAAVSGRHSFQQALQWLAMMSSSGVDIPVAVFQQFSALSGRFDMNVVETLPLVSAAFCSIWLRSLGRQDLHAVIGALHLRLAENIVQGLRGDPNAWPDLYVMVHFTYCAPSAHRSQRQLHSLVRSDMSPRCRMRAREVVEAWVRE